jgi:hypothetical protein
LLAAGEVEAQGEVLWSPLLGVEEVAVLWFPSLEAKEAEEEQAEVSFLGELLGWVLEKAVAV